MTRGRKGRRDLIAGIEEAKADPDRHCLEEAMRMPDRRVQGGPMANPGLNAGRARA
jgi:hypothetical protein